MSDKTETEDFLDDFFAAARTDTDAHAPEDLMARIMADADQLQPGPVSVQHTTHRRSFGVALLDTLGGWQGASGMVAATMASVLIGFSSADALTIGGLQSVFGLDTDYYISDIGSAFSFEEEG